MAARITSRKSGTDSRGYEIRRSATHAIGRLIRIGVEADGLTLTIKDEKSGRRFVVTVDRTNAVDIANALFDGKGTVKEIT